MKKIVGNGRWRLAIGIVAIGVLAFGLSVYGLAPPAATHAPAVTPTTASHQLGVSPAEDQLEKATLSTAGAQTLAAAKATEGAKGPCALRSPSSFSLARSGVPPIQDGQKLGSSGRGARSRADCGVDMITQNDDPVTITPGSVACAPDPADGSTVENNYARCFDITEAETLSCVEIGIESCDTLVGHTEYTCELVISTDTDGCPPTAPGGADLTELHRQDVAIPIPSELEILTVVLDPHLAIPVGPLVVELQCPDARGEDGLWVGSNAEEPSGDTFLHAASCGVTTYTETGDIGFPEMNWVLNLRVGLVPICGNGTLEGDEECEVGDPDGVLCTWEECWPPDEPLECTCKQKGACCDDLPHYTDPCVGGVCPEGEECCVFLDPPMCKTGPVCYENLTEQECAETYNGRWAGEDEDGEPITCDSMVPSCIWTGDHPGCDQGMLGPCGACCDESSDLCFKNYGETTCDSATLHNYTFHPGLVCDCDLPLSPPRCEEAPCSGACCYGEPDDCEVESKADCDARPGDFYNHGDCAPTGDLTFCECRECDPDYTMLEGEPECSDGYDDTYNDGCNAEEAPFPFTPIACGAKVCGTNGTHLENVSAGGTGWGPLRRETDWYRLVLDEPMGITWAASGGYPVHVMIIDAGSEDCVDYTILDGAIADEACLDASLTMDLAAGVYYLFVASPWLSATELLPVECGSIYNAELTCRSLDWLCTDLNLTVEIDDPYIPDGYSGVIALTGRTDVVRDAPPYEVGQVIETEMIELDLTGSHPVLGTVTITERPDMVSGGEIEVTAVDADGKLTGGVSTFGVHHRIIANLQWPQEEPVILFTQTEEGDPLPVPVASTIQALPPIGAIYVLTPADTVELWATICTGGKGGEGSRADEYIYDDGSTENMIGFGGETEAVWMHHFVREADQELLTGISTAFGSLAFQGYTGLEVDDPFRVYLWSDPDLDGDPADAVFIAEWGGTIEAGIIDTDLLQTVTIDPPVLLPPSFFIGASALNEADGVYLIPMDESDPLYDEESWFDSGGPPYDPTAPTFTHAIEAQPNPYQTNWLLRADAADGDCDEVVVGRIIDVWHYVERTIELDCDATGLPLEGEPTCADGYEDAYNGGCNSCPPIFQTIDCEDELCGESGTFEGPLCCETDADCPGSETCEGGYCTGGPYEIRDMDWYELELAANRTLITWTVTAEFDVDMWIMDGTAGCADRVTLAAVSGPPDAPCTPVVATADVCSPGTYWLVVAPSEFTGVPCGKEYTAEVTCEFLPDPVCGNGIRECDEECDPGDPGASPPIPPDDTDCPGDCYPVGDPRACTCKVFRACCVYDDPDWVCQGDYTDQECAALGGIWHGNASCDPTGELPMPICDQADCCHDNGLPLDDYGCPASQYAPDLPFAAGAADDFILKSTGDNPCQITKVTTWTVHWDGETEGHPVPADYQGINVTVYANMEPQGQPGGEPKENPADGTHVPYFEGGVVYTGFFDAFTAFDEAPTCLDNLWRIEIEIDDEDFLLQRNVKYWLEIQPVLDLADVVSPPSYGGRVAIAFSQNSHWDNAQRIYTFYEIPWTEVDGNDAATSEGCEDTPPEGTRRDLAFKLEGIEVVQVTPTAVSSYHEHDTFVCPLDLTTNNIEPRGVGIQSLLVTFSEDLTGKTVSGTVQCWDEDYIGTMTVLAPPTGAVVLLTFVPQLPDETCCRITFGGDVSGSVEVRSLAGDQNRDNTVTVGDVDVVKNYLGQDPTTEVLCNADLNASGVIEVGDSEAIKNYVGNQAADCP